MIAAIHVFIQDPQFQGQTKDKLNNTEVRSGWEVPSDLTWNIGLMNNNQAQAIRQSNSSSQGKDGK